ncbi:MAG TPA: Uma2 family endonuclease [Leptospiraceae bacterium]|nr:Uma2 family endonuclease [Leptospiraceae bacterium]HNC65184.1 Uma2 family endonuclease [Chitinophagales bacterium]HMY33829.1 Uma2 family endonuclease [Leptospiraceae bacterium]HMZ65940.1 Uma2 family endonuclease [Leptospiraceae bacterium]HNA08838.1 Uma2 family endonuclease [Leptospiraceae bacterium]
MSFPVLENPEVRKLFSTVSVEKYMQMIGLGVIPENTELIEGVIVHKMTKGPDHSYFSDILFDALSKIKPMHTIIRSEKPLTLLRTVPEPDISIISGSLEDFRNANPTTALLVVEIAKTSLNYDREKIPIYAEAKIENYWIVNLSKQQIETYQNPNGDDYSNKITYSAQDIISIFGKEIHLKEIFK